MSNQAIIVVTYEALREALGIPGDVDIAAIVQRPGDVLTSRVQILLKHPALPIHYEAAEPRAYTVEQIEEMVNG